MVIAALRWLLLFSPFPSCFSFYLPPSFLFPFSSAPSFLLPLLTSIPQKKALSLLRTPHRALFQLWLTGESSDEQWQLSRLCGAQETVRALPSATNHQPTPANCKLHIANCKLQTAHCKLQTANCYNPGIATIWNPPNKEQNAPNFETHFTQTDEARRVLATRTFNHSSLQRLSRQLCPLYRIMDKNQETKIWKRATLWLCLCDHKACH